MRIGIDIDDTVTKTNKIVPKLLKRYCKENKLKRYSKDKMLSDEEFHNFLNICGQELYETVQEKKNASKILRKWNSEGHKIYFITARHKDDCYNVEEYTKNYFNKLNIVYEDILFVKDNKYEAAKHLNLDFYIDDRKIELDKFNSSNVKLLHMVKHLKSESNYQKVTSWKQIDKIVNVLKEK